MLCFLLVIPSNSFKTNPPTPFPSTVLDSTILLSVLMNLPQTLNLVSMSKALLRIYSPALQKLQHQSLKCTDEDSTTEGVDKRSQTTLARTLV
ncbi:hypothetical protein V6N13_094086 [Hibiscus sabdariffa]|uniref:Uncharacterized protein n=2 Tax=Hibiscus sabdariffa TaxID=183260 RepID=A0ABR1Z5J6_9ROSI